MLGEATREQVLETSSFYLKQSNTMLVRGTWLRSIGEPLAPRTKVKKTLNAEKLEELYQEAKAEVSVS
jgi:hypothetical protein